MSLFKNISFSKKPAATIAGPPIPSANYYAVQNQSQSQGSNLEKLALNSIKDGVIITDTNGLIKMMNPAAATMTGNMDESFALGLDVSLVLIIEKKDGSAIEENQNPLVQAVKTGQSLSSKDFILAPKNSTKKYPIDFTVIPTNGPDRIITFRNIEKEVAEGNEQSEFISTASHEMRTPVASIEGYLALALNPQTATIDERARKYLESAQSSSQHLGRLFKDLLDVTKLDDHKIKPRNIPMDLTAYVKDISNGYLDKFKEKQINYIFGSGQSRLESRFLAPAIYAFCDVDFLHEIMSNLIENAIKYSPQGGSISVNVQGDDTRGIISVADTGIGIPTEDLQHVFQKFYRVDNRATREIGGTGLGLYLVKQRVESMNGSVWVESMFGKGSTFYVSLPRLSADEYQKRKIVLDNENQARRAQGLPVIGAAPANMEVPAAQQAVPQAQPTQAPTAQPVAPQAQPTQAITQPAVQQMPVAQAVASQTPVAQPVVPTMQQAQSVAPQAPAAQPAAPVAQPITQQAQPVAPAVQPNQPVNNTTQVN